VIHLDNGEKAQTVVEFGAMSPRPYPVQEKEIVNTLNSMADEWQ